MLSPFEKDEESLFFFSPLVVEPALLTVLVVVADKSSSAEVFAPLEGVLATLTLLFPTPTLLPEGGGVRFTSAFTFALSSPPLSLSSFEITLLGDAGSQSPFCPISYTFVPEGSVRSTNVGLKNAVSLGCPGGATLGSERFDGLCALIYLQTQTQTFLNPCASKCPEKIRSLRGWWQRGLWLGGAAVATLYDHGYYVNTANSGDTSCW